MEYKGFHIYTDSDKFFIPTPNFLFNPLGYATESAAKVAITKYLKQQEQAEQKLSNPPSVGNPEEFIDWLEESVNTINKIAERVYSTLVQQSRNKREGRYSGKYNQKHMRNKYFPDYDKVFANRKQRKAVKLAW